MQQLVAVLLLTLQVHAHVSSDPLISDLLEPEDPLVSDQTSPELTKHSFWHDEQLQQLPGLIPHVDPRPKPGPRPMHGPQQEPASRQTARFGAPDRPGWKWGRFVNHEDDCGDRHAGEEGCRQGQHALEPETDESWGVWAQHTWQLSREAAGRWMGGWGGWLRPPPVWRPELSPEEQSGEHALQSMLRQRLADEGLTGFNDSSLVPLLPYPVAWLLEDAEEELANATRLPVQLKRARTLAKQVSVSYCSHNAIRAWNCSRCHGNMEGFELERMTFDAQWDLAGYAGFSPHLDAMVVAFRGTDSHSYSNWAENMRYWRTDLHLPYPGAEGALVHTGFFLSYNSSHLAPNITEAVGNLMQRHPGKPLYVAGHSMGGALATLCAIDLKFAFGIPDVRVYTYGSPRVGNDIFARFFAANIQESIRVTHNRDIVPAWPPEVVGFHHVSREVWVIDVEHVGVIGICDDSGEDPRCHNSVCYLGLCTSVHDHLHYMGAGMFHRGGSC